MKKYPYEQPQADIFEVHMSGHIMDPSEYRKGGAGYYEVDDTVNNGEY